MALGESSVESDATARCASPLATPPPPPAFPSLEESSLISSMSEMFEICRGFLQGKLIEAVEQALLRSGASYQKIRHTSLKAISEPHSPGRTFALRSTLGHSCVCAAHGKAPEVVKVLSAFRVEASEGSERREIQSHLSLGQLGAFLVTLHMVEEVFNGVLTLRNVGPGFG